MVSRPPKAFSGRHFLISMRWPFGNHGMSFRTHLYQWSHLDGKAPGLCSFAESALGFVLWCGPSAVPFLCEAVFCRSLMRIALFHDTITHRDEPNYYHDEAYDGSSPLDCLDDGRYGGGQARARPRACSSARPCTCPSARPCACPGGCPGGCSLRE